MCINKKQPLAALKGFSILELMIAFAVLSLCLTFSLNLWFFNQNSVTAGENREMLLSRVLQVMAAMATSSQTHFADIVSTSTFIEGVLTKTDVQSLDPFTKTATVTASIPRGFSGTILPVLLHRTFYDFSRKAEQSSCATSFKLDWKNPFIMSTAFLSGSSTATSVKVQHEIAYVGANSALQSDPDLYIFAVSDPHSMKLLSSLNTGPGIESLALAWPYLFLANTSINAQLQVVDVSDPRNPILRLSFKLPGGFKDIGYVGNTLSYNRGLLALGTRKSLGPEVHLLNASNPLNPIEVAAYEAGSTINNIWLGDTSLYIATPLDEEFSILSISSAQQLQYSGGYNAQGLSGSGLSLYQLGSTMYLGRTVGEQELIALNTSSSSLPAVQSSVAVKSSVEGLLIRNPFLFLTSIDSAKQFEVWTIDSSSAFHQLRTLKLSSRGTAIDCDGEELFVATDGNPALYNLSSHT
jgi:type II secretory pathway pseudopilin PulG